VNEAHQTIVSSLKRLLRKQPVSLFGELRHRRPNVRHPETDVVQPRAPSFKVASDWRGVVGWLQELDTGVTDRQERHPHLLILNLFNTLHIDAV